MSDILYTSEKNIEGFKIVFTAEVDHDSFDVLNSLDESIKNETIESVHNGELVIFNAKIHAEKCNVVLAEDFLCGNIYENYSDFINMNDYYGDMVSTVIDSAKNKIKDLQN